MPNKNHFVLEGHIGRFPERKLSTSKAGKPWCSFGVSVSEKNRDGVKEYMNVRCICFGENAELASRMIDGQAVHCEGKIKASAYMDKKTNEPRATLEMVVFQMNPIAKEDYPKAAAPKQEFPRTKDEDEEIPF